MKMLAFTIILAFFSSAQAQWSDCFESFNSLFSLVEKSSAQEMAENALKSKDLAELNSFLEGQDFLSAQYLNSSADIKLHNEKVVDLLRHEERLSEPFNANGKSLRSAVTREQAQTLLDDMINTPCVRNSAPYQREGVSIGYCFGRAIIASMHALRRSVHPGAMKKVWVAGEMKGEWGHHVALMIRGLDDEWFVIDNVTGLVTHSQWMSTMQNHFRQNKELMFFVTRPERFGPQESTELDSINLFNIRNSQWDKFDPSADYYKGFFRDFFEWLDAEEEVIPFS